MNTWSNARGCTQQDVGFQAYTISASALKDVQQFPQSNVSWTLKFSRDKCVCFGFFFITGVHLGRSLDLDPLQLSEARRLCWIQIRRSDERRLHLNPSSLEFNFFCHIDSLKKSKYSQRARAMEGSSGERTWYSQGRKKNRENQKQRRDRHFVLIP